MGELMDNQKKITAAIAAVIHYIEEEEAVIMQQAAMGSMPQAPSVSAPTTTISPWAMNGRQTQMQMRNLMQMRTFR
jgi:ribosomal protein S12